MPEEGQGGRRSIPALRVRQWLADWDTIVWDKKQMRSEPEHWFYQFSMSASELRALCGIYPRTTKRKRGTEDFGIQRRLDEERSEEISRFVRFGFPWSDLSEAKRASGDFADLRQPGWLPTAIVVNILRADELRLGRSVDRDDLILVQGKEDQRTVSLALPSGFSGASWRPASVPPLEVIDGQHRLWAFDDSVLEGDFELPVVAFLGLDRSWQAYLFYTINIKPKKINPSLAFDLYPLLRTETWLEKFQGHVVYRETRAQEIVDLLWAHEESPWYHRINMLGERGRKGLEVTQAAWIRSLLAAIIKSWEGRGVRIGGLFGTPIGKNETVLPWTRTEQAAFLIAAGQFLAEAVKRSDSEWAEALRNAGKDRREGPGPEETQDLAFFGPNSLLNQDQGIRTLLHVLNDTCFVMAEEIGLLDWKGDDRQHGGDEEQVTQAVKAFRSDRKVGKFLRQLADGLAAYDWRASSGPGLSSEESLRKAAFRGSGGYKVLRQDVLSHLAEGSGAVARAAKNVLAVLER